MKGIIFTEFVEMVEDKFSPEMVDSIIESSDLPSGGAYTAVGTYDHSELVSLVGALSNETGVDAVDLIHVYCNHLFVRFSEIHPHFFEGQKDTLEFLKLVDSYIHVEVKKLNPDAELPRFTYKENGKDELEMTYHSSRHLGDVAEGLLRGCIEFFGEDIEFDRIDGLQDGESKIQFNIRRAA